MLAHLAHLLYYLLFNQIIDLLLVWLDGQLHADSALQYDIELVASAAPFKHVLPALALLVREALPDLREIALLDVVSLLEKLDVLQ